MLPIAQIAWSTIPKLFDRSRFTKRGMPPWSIINWHCSVVPEAIFARAQVAYSWSWWYSYCLIYLIIIGIKPASITVWIMGVFSVMDRSLRMPITPWCWFNMLLPSFMHAIRFAKLSIEYFVRINLSIHLSTVLSPCGTSHRQWVVYFLYFLQGRCCPIQWDSWNRQAVPVIETRFTLIIK